MRNPLHLLFAIAAVLSTTKAFPAEKEIFHKHIQGSSIQPNARFKVKDDKFGDVTQWSKIDTILQVKNMVILEINEDTAMVLPDTFTLKLNVRVWYFKDSAHPSTIAATKDITLIIHYDSAQAKPFNYRTFYLENDYFKDSVKILSIKYRGSTTTNPPDFFRLTAEIQVTRIYNFDCSTAPSFPVSALVNPQNTFLQTVQWSPYDGAEEYDFEWTFYDDSSKVASANPATLNFDSLFTNNATRITTEENQYTINKIYPGGYVYYRVRAVHYDAYERRITTPWTNKGLTYISHKFHVDWYEPDFNWTASTIFSEEGKKKSTVSYFDGSQRNRQTISTVNTDTFKILTQTLYDHQGRPALTVLPTPVTGWNTYYQTQFNRYGGVTYDRLDFDTGECDYSPLPMDSTYGSSKYYSTNINHYFDYYFYVPTAKGYPFSVTEYTPDLTGRIKRQSGVGSDLQLGFGHETKYFYGIPAQEELDRIFGNEVGYAGHYLKNLVLDPNGQGSVSYIDAHGRTIATALTGPVPSNVSALSSYASPHSLKVNLLTDTQKVAPTISDHYSLLASNVGNYVFHYSAQREEWEPDCTEDICYDCYYNFLLKITDNCGNQTLPGDTNYIKNFNNFPVGDPPPFDTICNGSDGLATKDFTLSLDRGSYEIQKTATISQQALDYYVGKYLLQNNCIVPFDTFLAHATKAIDFSGCNMTCEECNEELGTQDDYVHSYIVALDSSGKTAIASDTTAAITIYNQMADECDKLCNGASACSILYEQLVQDVSMGGQYGKYDFDENVDTFSCSIATSVFYGTSWQNPDPVYHDENGDTSFILYNDSSYYPQDVPLNVFLSHWQSSWGLSLVKYHPEYCYWQFCNDNGESENYDEAMMKVNTYAEAVDSGYLDPTEINGPSLNPDPFFASGGLGSSDLGNIDNKLVSYFDSAGIKFTVWNFVTSIVECNGNLSCGASIGSACEGDANAEWILFRALYLNLKYYFLDSLREIYINNTGITLAFQGGEPGDSWNYEIKGPVNPNGATYATQTQNKSSGTTSLVMGGAPTGGGGDCITGCCTGNGTNTIDTIAFNTLHFDYSNDLLLTLDFGNYYSAVGVAGCSGSGWDLSENLKFVPIVDGTALSPIALGSGFGDLHVAMHETDYGLPACSTFAFLLIFNCNRKDEMVFIDDVKLIKPCQSNVCIGIADNPWLDNNNYINTGGCSGDYTTGYQPHIIHWNTTGPAPLIDLTDTAATIASAESFVSSYITTSCDSNCEKNADLWIHQLEACPAFLALAPSAKDSIHDGFVEVCMAGCDFNSPYGTTVLPIGDSTTSKYHSLADVLFKHGISPNDTTYCNALNFVISNPSSVFPATHVVTADTCLCDQVAEFKTQFDITTNYQALSDSIFEHYGYTMSAHDLGILDSACLGSCHYLPEPIHIAPMMVCGEDDCIDCSAMKYYQSLFINTFLTDSFSLYSTLFTNFMNQQLNYDLRWEDYKSFMDSCEALGFTFLDTFKLIQDVDTITDNVFTLPITLNYDIGTNTFSGGSMSNGITVVSNYYPDVTGTNIQLITDSLHLMLIDSFCVLTQFPIQDTDPYNYINLNLNSPYTFLPYMGAAFELTICSNCLPYTLVCGAVINSNSISITGVNDTIPGGCFDSGILCNEPILDQLTLDTTDCMDQLMSLAAANAQASYQQYLDSVTQAFTANYISHCMELIDTFTLVEPFNEHHYTLYYYDQAGNLVKTIPPRGVDTLDATERAAVAAHRANSSSPAKYPAHVDSTRYWYNSLEKPTKQLTVDGGTTLFWYDKIGRLVVSQNFEQAQHNDYSYTLYDGLGRIIEVGQLTQSHAMKDDTSMNPTALANWITHGSSREEVTKTFYDAAIKTIPNLTQENLRNRVATIAFQNSYSAIDTVYDRATHYSYDIEGNVKTLIQDNPDLEDFVQRYKRIDYEYDLISGKVNQVSYQKDSSDQYIHLYEYDEENRLIQAKTSGDNLLFDLDADYEYYAHGPMARLELGERQVQGVDYAYTIQGWLKGINSVNLNFNRDMGHDGNPAIPKNKKVGRDVYGMAINYFNGDYFPAGGNARNLDPRHFSTSTLFTASPELFNGNIRNISYTIRWTKPLTVGYAYKYDQLNRLIEKNTYKNFDATNYGWKTSGAALTAYKELLSYDPNGNILTYLRRGDTTQPKMDSLTYQYYSHNNRLNYVDDNTTYSSNYSIDIDDQSSGNYTYDHIGNLVGDSQEGLSITWNDYGKVKSVANSNTNTTINFAYDATGNRVMKQVVNTTSHDTSNTYYMRDAQGNIMTNYTLHEDTVRWSEQDLYGSSRLGVLYPDSIVFPRLTQSQYYHNMEGEKQYELTNHLGNVLAVINDKKIGRDTVGSDGLYDYWIAAQMSGQDYYSYGMVEHLRSFSYENYKFAFGGKEKDNELKGNANSYNYESRLQDPRLGRFMSVDPLTASFAFWTPYQFAGNSPIRFIDPDGKEIEILTLGTDEILTLSDDDVVIDEATGRLVRSPLVRNIGKYSSENQTKTNEIESKTLDEVKEAFDEGAEKTKSSRAEGQQEHNQYKEANRSQGFTAERVLRNGLRPDAWKIWQEGDTWKGLLKDLKPNNWQAISRAVPQMAKYVDQLIQEHPEVTEWTQIIETYTVTGISLTSGPQYTVTSTLIYTVQPNDVLSKIAKMYDTTVENLIVDNNISDPNLIQPGQQLQVGKVQENTTYTR